jgi:DNA-binding transcriptional LysR family regulator
MEFHQLTSFVTVARTGNLTRAAAELNTTPPAVSTHIRQLEEELGLVLFTRTAKGMRLTSQGQGMEKKARDILLASDEMQALAKTLQQEIRGRVRLGINAGPDFLKIPDTIRALFRKHPGIGLEIIISSTGEILKQVEAGILDCGFAFGSRMTSRVESVFLSPVGLEIVIPMAFKDRFPSGDFTAVAALPWIFPSHPCPFLDTVVSFLKERGMELQNKIFANDDITKAAFIEQGLAVSVLEKSEANDYAQRQKAFFWQGEERFETALFFVYSRQRAGDRLIRTVADCLTDPWKTS